MSESDRSPPLAPGLVLDERFNLVRRLGRGGYGTVWAARDRGRGDALVAVKILHPHLCDEPRVLARLTREAEILTRLDHPNMAGALHFSTGGPRVFLVVEYVEGHTLAVHIGQHTKRAMHMSLTVIAKYTAEICGALGYAHAQGIVHRDIKPHNVMIEGLGEQERVRVLDFGVARRHDTSRFDATTLGRTFGSPMYMAPEQIRGEPGDARTDIFGLGCVLFEMITLHRTWARDPDARPIAAFDRPLKQTGSNARVKILTRIVSGARTPPSALRADVPPALDAIVLAAIDPDPARRPPTAGSLAAAVFEAVAGAAPSRPAPQARAQSGPEPDIADEPTIAKTASVLTPRAALDGIVAPDELPAPGPEATLPDPTQPTTLPGQPAPALAAPSDILRTDASPIPALDEPAAPQPDWHDLPAAAGAPAPEPGAEHQDTQPGTTPGREPDTQPGAAAPAVLDVAVASGASVQAGLQSTSPRRALGPGAAWAPVSQPHLHAVRSGPPLMTLVAGAVLFTALGFGAAVLWLQRDRAQPIESIVVPIGEPICAPIGAPVGEPAAVAPPLGRLGAAKAPQPAPTDAPESPPAVSEAAPAKRQSPRRAQAAPAPDEDGVTRRLAPLSRLRAAAREDPGDGARISRLGDAIAASAEAVADPSERRRIRRLAASDAMVGDLDGLALCLERLEAALRQ